MTTPHHTAAMREDEERDFDAWMIEEGYVEPDTAKNAATLAILYAARVGGVDSPVDYGDAEEIAAAALQGIAEYERTRSKEVVEGDRLEAVARAIFEADTGASKNFAAHLYLPLGRASIAADEQWRAIHQPADAPTIADYEASAADTRRLVRELDVLLNGDGAAEQASLCDIVAQVKHMKYQPADAQGLVREPWHDLDDLPPDGEDVLLAMQSGSILVGFYQAPSDGFRMSGFCTWSQKMKCVVKPVGVRQWMKLPKPE